jgi:hypothetical protein
LFYSQKEGDHLEVARVQQQGHIGPFSHRQCHVLLLQADVVAQKKAATGNVELLGFV